MDKKNEEKKVNGKGQFTFETLVEVLKNCTPEQLTEICTILGPIATASGNKTQKDGTKIQGTGQEIDVAKPLAQQVKILITSLPTDKAVSMTEWGQLAVANGLQTQQEPMRIASYYKKVVIDLGYGKAIQ
jgi:hypothetical protein